MTRQYKLARKMKKIKLTVAAQALGVSQPTLSAWESGQRNPSVDALINMSEYYGVSVDFLLGISSERDPRTGILKPITPETLPILHETPVYSSQNGWAMVDAVERQLRFANGVTLPFADVGEIYYLPPAFEAAGIPHGKPLKKSEISDCDELWVEPISADSALRTELQGWYHVKKWYVEDEAGQRFYFDFYGAKWLAFAAMGFNSTEERATEYEIEKNDTGRQVRSN